MAWMGCGAARQLMQAGDALEQLARVADQHLQHPGSGDHQRRGDRQQLGDERQRALVDLGRRLEGADDAVR